MSESEEAVAILLEDMQNIRQVHFIILFSQPNAYSISIRSNISKRFRIILWEMKIYRSLAFHFLESLF